MFTLLAHCLGSSQQHMLLLLLGSSWTVKMAIYCVQTGAPLICRTWQHPLLWAPLKPLRLCSPYADSVESRREMARSSRWSIYKHYIIYYNSSLFPRAPPPQPPKSVIEPLLLLLYRNTLLIPGRLPCATRVC
jgi:hypothetical protein